MIPLTKIAAAVAAVGSIGGGALALDKMHVAASDFKEYIEQQQMADERDYVLNLKEEIRTVRKALELNPEDEYLVEALADLMDELCELRPNDRLCKEQ